MIPERNSLQGRFNRVGSSLDHRFFDCMDSRLQTGFMNCRNCVVQFLRRRVQTSRNLICNNFHAPQPELFGRERRRLAGIHRLVL